MFKFSVGDKDYKIRYDYRALARTDVLSRAEGMSNITDMAKVIQDTAEFLLVGLQKYHSDEFGYFEEDGTESKRAKEYALDKVYALMDEMDENDVSVLDIFNEISEELVKCGFLSQLLGATEDHKPKSKGKKAEASAK